jgi:hypothetical protein
MKSLRDIETFSKFSWSYFYKKFPRISLKAGCHTDRVYYGLQNDFATSLFSLHWKARARNEINLWSWFLTVFTQQRLSYFYETQLQTQAHRSECRKCCESLSSVRFHQFFCKLPQVRYLWRKIRVAIPSVLNGIRWNLMELVEMSPESSYRNRYPNVGARTLSEICRLQSDSTGRPGYREWALTVYSKKFGCNSSFHCTVRECNTVEIATN